MMTFQPSTFSLVIPCLNEIDAIPSIAASLENLRTKLLMVGIYQFEVIVVDDHSDDGSWELLQKMPGIRAVRNERRLNYGGSLKRGFQLAKGEIIGFMDMDSTYDPQEFVSMIQALRGTGAAVVCGDRLSRLTEMPWLRKLGNRFFIFFIYALFFKKIQDSCTGQRVFFRNFGQVFTSLPNSGLNFSLAMTLTCLTRRVPVLEIPVAYGERIGSSKLSVVGDGLRFAATIVSYWLKCKIKRTKVEAINSIPLSSDFDHNKSTTFDSL